MWQHLTKKPECNIYIRSILIQSPEPADAAVNDVNEDLDVDSNMDLDEDDGDEEDRWKTMI